MNLVPFIVGPTGVGKTEISLMIADKIDIEIVSADSRQIYRYMDIGTAKPGQKSLAKVKHHFISYLNPDQHYSAGIYGREARTVIEKTLKTRMIPVVVGGSGFYIQALKDGLSNMEDTDNGTRKYLKQRLRYEELSDLYDELVAVDPQLAKSLNKNDKQRILRGLEVYYGTGRKLSELKTVPAKIADFKPLMFGLTAERSVLYNRINRRVETMLANGLIDEVKNLIKMGYSAEQNALNTVGYKEVFKYLDGKLDYAEMKEQIQKNSRNYAKRQITWFKRDPGIQWFNVGEESGSVGIASQILDKFKNTRF